MMGTQRKAEHGVIQSSIALLQERFKQLQQVKEMREKRELLRMFSEYQNITTTTSTTTTTTTISSTSTTTNSNNNNNFPSDHSTMQYKYEPPHDGVDDELQIFLPPNYYHHHHHKPKASSYASSSSSSSLSSSSTPPSTSPSSNYQNYYCNDVSLSLWPPTSCNNNNVNLGPRTSLEVPISTRSFLRPPTMEISRSSPTCAFKLEDYSHVSDVDTTLHL